MLILLCFAFYDKVIEREKAVACKQQIDGHRHQCQIELIAMKETNLVFYGCNGTSHEKNKQKGKQADGKPDNEKDSANDFKPCHTVCEQFRKRQIVAGKPVGNRRNSFLQFCQAVNNEDCTQYNPENKPSKFTFPQSNPLSTTFFIILLLLVQR